MNDRTALIAIMAAILYANKRDNGAYAAITKAIEILDATEQAESAQQGGAAMGAAVTAPSCTKGE